MSSAADEFAELFPAVYLRLHARADQGERLTPQMAAVLRHLALSGPMTVARWPSISAARARVARTWSR